MRFRAWVYLGFTSLVGVLVKIIVLWGFSA